MAAPTKTFNVADIITTLAAQEGVKLTVEGITDICYGCVITSEKSLNSFLTDHAIPYNYQIIDGDPIRVVRRAINTDLVIDYEINQSECIVKTGSAAVGFRRVDVASLPRAVEIQYTDPERIFATSTQVARHPGAPTTNASASYSLDFIITGAIARVMAFDTLYRIWSQQLAVSFEHRDLTIEPGDVIRLTCDQGVFVVLVTEATYTVRRTITVAGFSLLTTSGITIAAGVPDAGEISKEITGSAHLTDTVKHLLLPAPGDSPAVKRTHLNFITIVNLGTVDATVYVYDGNTTSPDVWIDAFFVSAGGTVEKDYTATSPDAGLAATAGKGIYVRSSVVSTIDVYGTGIFV